MGAKVSALSADTYTNTNLEEVMKLTPTLCQTCYGTGWLPQTAHQIASGSKSFNICPDCYGGGAIGSVTPTPPRSGLDRLADDIVRASLPLRIDTG